MVELGELESQHQEFDKRNVRIVAVSNDDQETAQKTQADFPNLLIISDRDQKIANALQVIHAGAAADGSDTNAPTTFLIDGAGQVRWLYRPGHFMVRLSPTELLAAVDQTWPEK